MRARLAGATLIRMPRGLPPRAELKVALQEHQVLRLRDTYADLMADPAWAPLGQFFFSDLYMVGDRSERNESFLKLYRHFERVFDASFLSGVKSLIDFYMLSEKLDDEVTAVLERMGAGAQFTSAEYEQAYRWAEHYDARVEQLRFVDETLTFVHRMAHRRLIGMLIRTMRATARVVGAGAMVEFLDRGYRAFRDTEDISHFKETIGRREKERLDRIYREIPPDRRGRRRA